jgi:TIR domain
MAHLSFICHSAEDFEISNRIVEKLENAGIPCWIAPRNIPPGLTYAASIIKGIKSSDFFIFVFTRSSNESDAVINEIENANALKKHIIPFKIHNLAYSDSLEYYLRSKQSVNAYDVSLDAAVADLIKYINSISSPPGVQVTPGITKPPIISDPKKTTGIKYVLIACAVMIVLIILIVPYFKNQNKTIQKESAATGKDLPDTAKSAGVKDLNISSKIYSQGRLTLEGSYLYDLDLGLKLGADDFYGPKIEIFYECKTDIERYFRPMSGAFYLLGHRDFNSITANSLTDLSYSKANINVSNNENNQLTAGTVVAVKTNEGRFAKFIIDAFGTGQWGSNIEISWVTYEMGK